MTLDEQRQLVLSDLSGARYDDPAPGLVRARKQADRVDDLTRRG